MGPFTAGEVVLIPFPFSDLTRSKLRPVLLLAAAGRGDWIACQITSNPYGDPGAVEITQSAFVSGGLQRISYARPAKLFTAHESLAVSSAGIVASTVLECTRSCCARSSAKHFVTVPLSPHRSFNVVSANSANTSAMIQNRAITLLSLHPINSK